MSPFQRAARAGSVGTVRCPSCLAVDTRVVDSRTAEDGAAIRRRRLCPACGYRFTTYERLDQVPLSVIKRSGQREPFDRAKVVAGVRAAAKGRPVSDARIEELAVDVEDSLRLDGPEVTSAQVGLAVLDALRRIDEVAYVRFASVYKNFAEAADFEREIILLGGRGALAKGSEPKQH
jgi:transcriptional repressor NrdR